MKKLYLILLVVGLWSCDDMLRVEPENSLTFGNITTENDIESLTLGVGSSVRNMVCWNAFAIPRAEWNLIRCSQAQV